MKKVRYVTSIVEKKHPNKLLEGPGSESLNRSCTKSIKTKFYPEEHFGEWHKKHFRFFKHNLGDSVVKTEKDQFQLLTSQWLEDWMQPFRVLAIKQHLMNKKNIYNFSSTNYEMSW